MKKLLQALGIWTVLFICLSLGYALATAPDPQPTTQSGPRFEVLRSQLVKTPMDQIDYMIYALHDRDSGVEFICTQQDTSKGNSISCFPTGRKW